MRIEIDQSGKIEKTEKDTILAFSNEEKYTILIDRRIKQKIFSRIKNRRKLQIKIFTICVYLLIKDNLNNKEMITIDEEYPGYNRLIKNHLMDLIREGCQKLDQNMIRFERISKKSNVHNLAILTYRKSLKPNKIIKEQEILELLK